MPTSSHVARARAASSRLSLLVVVLAAAGNLGLALGSGASTERVLLGSALLWVSALPGYLYFRRRERGIPFVPTMAIVYFVAYGQPAFSDALAVRGMRLDDVYVDRALVLALLGEVLLLAAFYGTRLRSVPRLRLPLDLPGGADRLLAVGWAFALVRFLVPQQAIPLSLMQVMVVLFFLPVACLSGLLLLRLRGQLSPARTALAAVLLAALLAKDFATASVAVPLMTVATLLFVYIAERGHVPLLTVALVTVVAIPSLGTKQHFREILSRRGELTTLQRVRVFGGLVLDVLENGSGAYENALQVSDRRVDHLSAFAYVIEQTPGAVPYWDGATYADFFWSFIPRAVYPDKPLKTMGQSYGHRYRFIDEADTWTSINLEQTVEMYANFGVAGVLFGMLLMGLLYRGLYAALNHPAAGDGGIIIAAATFHTLLNIESDFSLVFGGIVQAAVVLYVALRLLAGTGGRSGGLARSSTSS